MIIRTNAEVAQRRMNARRSQRVGADAENVVKSRLILKGLAMVERISVGWTLTRGPGGKILGGTPNAPVSGDFRAVAAGGQSVLVEVKWRPDVLRFSDLEPHQRRALDAHHAFGGLSLLAWVHLGGVAIMVWPLPTFARGSSITAADAAALEWKP